MGQTNGLSGGSGGRIRGNSDSSRDDSDEARSGGSSSKEVRARGGWVHSDGGRMEDV